MVVIAFSNSSIFEHAFKANIEIEFNFSDFFSIQKHYSSFWILYFSQR